LFFMKNATLSGGVMKRNGLMSFIVAKRNVIVEVISALFILLFVYTAINKFLEFNSLKIALKGYPLIGSFPILIAWALPLTEAIVSILLFVPKTRLLGLYASLVLMSSFTLYLAYMLLFTPTLPCTCGGLLQKLSWPQHLVVNVAFILQAVIGIWLKQKRETPNVNIETAPIIFT
jgi:putative oxidoreductase